MSSARQPCRPAEIWIAAVISAASARQAASVSPRTSSQASTREAMTLVPPGTGTMRPTVARALTPPAGSSRAPAISLAASTAADAATTGSLRPAIGVAPAWLPSPVKVTRHRPWARIAEATATGAPRSASARPCSTCSSTKAPSEARRSSSRPIPAGSIPAAAAAWANVTPSASASAVTAAGSSAPVISFDPRQAMPNLDPSSSANAITATGRAGVKPRSRSLATADSADATPSGPSSGPPPGTESRWLPVPTVPGPGSPQCAQMLPFLSGSTVSPSAAARPVNQARSSSSADSNTCRE